MSVIVLLLFLGFFYYLAQRLWTQRGMEAQMAAGPHRSSGSQVTTHREETSFGAPSGQAWANNPPRNTDDAA